MGNLEIKVLSREEALKNKDFDQQWDCDNTLLRGNSLVRLAIAYSAVRFGFEKEFAFKYRNILEEVYHFSKRLVLKPKLDHLGLLWDIMQSLNIAIGYKAGLPEQFVFGHLTKHLKGCPLNLVDYVAENMNLSRDIWQMEGKKIQVCSRNHWYIVKKVLETKEDFFSKHVKQPVYIIANDFEVKNNVYTGKVKEINVTNGNFWKYAQGKDIFNKKRFLYL